MKSLSFYIALWLSKLAIIPLHILGHDATNFPGVLAKKIDSHFFEKINKPSTIIAITGTNGKTTTTNLISDILKLNGYPNLCNTLGANIDSGIITSLINNVTLFNQKKVNLAVLEIDERSAPRIYPYLKPNILVITNLFRDSYKRNATCEYIANILNEYIPDESFLIVNGEDIISSNLKPQNKRLAFAVDYEKKSLVSSPNIINDAYVCPNCFNSLNYTYHRYNHIGVASCSCCGLKTPTANILATKFNKETKNLEVKLPNNEILTIKTPGTRFADIANNLAAIGACYHFGLTSEEIVKGFATLNITTTRYLNFEAGKRKVITLMAKGQNPVANSGVYNDLRLTKGNKEVIFFIEDLNDRQEGSENFAWIYSADFEYLKDDSFKRFIIAGPRNLDIQLRMLLAGIKKEKIFLCDKEEDVINLVEKESNNDIYILYDTTSVNLGHKIGQKIANKLKEH